MRTFIKTLIIQISNKGYFLSIFFFILIFTTFPQRFKRDIRESTLSRVAMTIERKKTKEEVQVWKFFFSFLFFLVSKEIIIIITYFYKGYWYEQISCSFISNEKNWFKTRRYWKRLELIFFIILFKKSFKFQIMDDIWIFFKNISNYGLEQIKSQWRNGRYSIKMFTNSRWSNCIS